MRHDLARKGFIGCKGPPAAFNMKIIHIFVFKQRSSTEATEIASVERFESG